MTASTSRLCDPKLLLFVRITQLFLCPTFLVLLCYAVAHRGYWTKTSGALALGIITSLFNLAVSSYHLYTAHYLKRISQTWFTRMSRYLVELLLVLMWAATTALMVRPKGKDFRLAFDKPPKVIWIMCIATAVHQVALYGISFVMAVVFALRRDRAPRIEAESDGERLGSIQRLDSVPMV